MSRRVFLAHASTDKPEVLAVASALVKLDKNLDIWIDKWSLVPGDSIIRRIDDALLASDRLVVFLTPDSLASGWVRNEVAAGLVLEIAKQKGFPGENFVVPAYFKVLPQGVHIPPLLAHKLYANFVDGETFDGAVAELHRGIVGKALGPQDVPFSNLEIRWELFNGPSPTPFGLRVTFKPRLTPEMVNYRIELGQNYASVSHFYATRQDYQSENGSWSDKGDTWWGRKVSDPPLKQNSPLTVEFLNDVPFANPAGLVISPFM